MFINFTHKGKEYKLPLLMRPKVSAYNCLAVVHFAQDVKPRLQLVSSGYAKSSAIKVKGLNVLSTDYLPTVGRVLLSRSAKRAWLDDGYAHRLTQFTITES